MRERAIVGKITISQVPSKDQLADGLAKSALSKARFCGLRNLLKVKNKEEFDSTG